MEAAFAGMKTVEVKAKREPKPVDLEQIRASLAGEKLGGATAQGGTVANTPSVDPATARLNELRASLAKEKDSGEASAAS